jgi:hypothetical protein
MALIIKIDAIGRKAEPLCYSGILSIPAMPDDL